MATKDVPTLLVLETFEEWRPRAEIRDRLMRGSGQCEKVVWRAMEREDRRGHLDYGLWLWGAWLTPKGQAELARLRAAATPKV